MSYEVRLNEDDGIVEVTYHGTVTLEERKEAVDEGCALHENTRPYLVLVDVRDLVMNEGAMEQKIFAEYLANQPPLNATNTKVAVLHKEKHNPYVLLSAFVFLKGQERAQFDNEKHTRDWLKGRFS